MPQLRLHTDTRLSVPQLRLHMIDLTHQPHLQLPSARAPPQYLLDRLQKINRFRANVRLLSSWHDPQAALKCSYCSDSVTRD